MTSGHSQLKKRLLKALHINFTFLMTLLCFLFIVSPFLSFRPGLPHLFGLLSIYQTLRAFLLAFPSAWYSLIWNSFLPSDFYSNTNSQWYLPQPPCLYCLSFPPQNSFHLPYCTFSSVISSLQSIILSVCFFL